MLSFYTWNQYFYLIFLPKCFLGFIYILPDIFFMIIFFLTFYNPILKEFFFDVNLIRTQRIYLTVKDFWYLEEKLKSEGKLSRKEEEMLIKGRYLKEVTKDIKKQTDFESELYSILNLFIVINMITMFIFSWGKYNLESLINDNFKYWFFVLMMLLLTLIISVYSIRWIFIRIELLYRHTMYVPYYRPESFPRFNFKKLEFTKKDKYRLKNQMLLSISSVLGLLYILKNIFLFIIVFIL